jgi:serine/threonine-protein kinase
MGRLDPKIAVDLALQACDALGEAHLRGIVHRDIKPSNLFVTQRRDKSDLLKVLDFGISKVPAGQELSITQTASVLGTPAYMSPEQMRSARTVDARSDIWGLGCVLYELVEGHPPFIASNFAELCVLVSTEPFKPLVHAPELTPIIEKCLAKGLDDRFQTMVELATALVPFAPDPARAEKEVAKIHRRLGMTPPGGVPVNELKSSPKLRAPTFEGEAPTSVTTDVRPVLIGPNRKLEPEPPPPAPKNMSTFWLVIVLILLFGVGIAAGLLVTSTNAC